MENINIQRSDIAYKTITILALSWNFMPIPSIPTNFPSPPLTPTHPILLHFDIRNSRSYFTYHKFEGLKQLGILKT